MKIRTLIVDDERLARARVRRMLKDEANFEVTGECRNGREAVSFIRQEKPDLVFLDVQMPVMGGLEVLQTIGAKAVPALVFVTAFDQYAIQAFDFYALDYLLKPFSRQRFAQTIERVKEQFERPETLLSPPAKQSAPHPLEERLVSLIQDLQEKKYLERIVVKTAGRVFFLKTDEIDWIEAAGNYLELHAGRATHLIRETMHGIEGKLDPGKFLRIHRSVIVRIDRIKEMHPMFSGDYTVVLHDGTELSMSRTFRDRWENLLDRSS
jgi:two-component system, LytTR family, response regulator